MAREEAVGREPATLICMYFIKQSAQGTESEQLRSFIFQLQTELGSPSLRSLSLLEPLRVPGPGASGSRSYPRGLREYILEKAPVLVLILSLFSCACGQVT